MVHEFEGEIINPSPRRKMYQAVMQYAIVGVGSSSVYALCHDFALAHTVHKAIGGKGYVIMHLETGAVIS